MSRADAMSATATLLVRESDSVLTQRTRRYDHWRDVLGTGLSGPAPDAAGANINAYADQLRIPAENMGRAGDIIAGFAVVQRQLEAIEIQAARLTATAVADQALGILQGLRELGDALDWACARSIEALCTPAYPAPPMRLEDYADLPTTEIHHLQMAQAPPKVHQLVRDNPDLRVLEVEGDRLVAVIDASGLDTQAASVTTFVPGVHSSEPANWQNQVDTVRAISKATGGPAVMWLGYNAPATLAHAIHTDPARQGGQELVRFQRGIGKHYPNARRVVIGYSYGSVVAGQAASSGQRLPTDALVLIGSPGVGVSSADELQLDPRSPADTGRVYATTAVGDPIALTGTQLSGLHGPNPALEYFGAEPVPGTQLMTGSHTEYFSDPVMLRGLGVIARGG